MLLKTIAADEPDDRKSFLVVFLNSGGGGGVPSRGREMPPDTPRQVALSESHICVHIIFVLFIIINNVLSVSLNETEPSPHPKTKTILKFQLQIRIELFLVPANALRFV